MNGTECSHCVVSVCVRVCVCVGMDRIEDPSATDPVTVQFQPVVVPTRNALSFEKTSV